MKFRKKLIITGTISVLILILIYGFFNARLLIAGPQIEIFSPENGMSFDTPFIEIFGKARNTSFISMNGNPIYINENDEFREKLLLSPGTSIIKIDARDRFERSTEKILWYTYDGEPTKINVPEVPIETSSSSPVSTTSSSSLD